MLFGDWCEVLFIIRSLSLSNTVHTHKCTHTYTHTVQTNTRLLPENPAVSSRACFWRVMTLAESLVYSSLSPLLLSPQSWSLHSLFAVLFGSLLNSTQAAFSGGLASRHDCVAQSNYTQQDKTRCCPSLSPLPPSHLLSLFLSTSSFSPFLCSFIFPGYILDG